MSTKETEPTTAPQETPKEMATEETKENPTAVAPEGSPLEVQFINVTVKTPKGLTMPLSISLSETFQELYQLIIDNRETCHMTSFALRFNDTLIQDFVELSSIEGLQEGSELELIEIPYTEYSSKQHIQRLNEFLSQDRAEPISIYSRLTRQTEKETLEVGNEMKKIETVKKPNNKGKKGKKGKKKQVTKKNNAQQKAEEGNRSLIEKLFAFEYGTAELNKFFPDNQSNVPQCIQSLIYSGWNPAPKNRFSRGDLSYLRVSTLEKKTIHITSSSQGFFVNKSTDTTFNPLPEDNSPSAHSLVDVLRSVSPLFKSKFDLLLDQLFSGHPFEIIPVQNPDQSLSWLKEDTPHTCDPNRTQRMKDKQQLQLRDWNAEYQSLREMPKESQQERCIRDRHLAKLYADFSESATEGARSIIDGNAQALNPNDPLPSRLYLQDNIFFSHALNGRLTFDEGEGDMGPYKGVNNDLRGVYMYDLFDTEGLHTILTVLVTYRGYRMVAQSIIPGILHSIGQDSIKYGSMDHGATYLWNEDFHSLISEAGKKLRIPEHKVKGEDGKIVTICCASEAKGVLGTDGRKYILDLDHTTARDANFTENWALLRPELYDIYTDWCKHKHLLQHKKEYEALVEKKKKGEEILPEDAIPEFVPPMFNPNAYDLKKATHVDEPEVVERQKEQIKALAKFIIDHMIPTLVNKFLSNQSYPTDSSSLTGAFHMHGLNMRYLGMVTNKLENGKPFLRDLMIREMIARSTKHIFFTFLRDVANHEIADATTHFLNCFVRGAFIRNYNNPKAPAETIDEKMGLTPSILWEKITDQIKTQFRFDLKSEDFVASKYIQPTLRVLCQKCGIQLKAKLYDGYVIQPVEEDDVIGLFPVSKVPELASVDGNKLMEQSKILISQGKIEPAYEKLSEALNIYHSIFGPIHLKTAQCFTRMAMVLSIFGDGALALVNQSKAIIILERIAGLDNSDTSYEYGHLGSYYHQVQHDTLAFAFMKRAYYLSTLIGGEMHPDNANNLSLIGAIFEGVKLYPRAIEALQKSIACYEYHFGPRHPSIAPTYHRIANCYTHMGDFRMALQNERKYYAVIKETYGPKDQRLADSISYTKALEGFLNESDKKEKPSVPSIDNSNTNRATDDNIGSLPISDILKYINNTSVDHKRPRRK